MTATRRIQDIQGWELEAPDGVVGTYGDFLLGDVDWIAQYIVANTRKWLPGRKMLISPIAVTGFDEQDNRLKRDLTKEQIKEAPPLDSDAPVSRRYEELFNQYLAWQNYWSGASTWGLHLAPRLLHQSSETIVRGQKRQPDSADLVPENETHLRSISEVIDYHIHAADEEVGHIEDFLLDQETWAIGSTSSSIPATGCPAVSGW